MLFRTHSVHGFGMQESLLVVFLDAGGRVLGVRDLRPRSIARDRSATWSLELPGDAVRPAIGDRLIVSQPVGGGSRRSGFGTSRTCDFRPET